MTGHDIVCLHTMVGTLRSTYTWFGPGNGAELKGTESHVGVGGPWGNDGTAGLDGVAWQFQDLLHEADANLDGGKRVLSIETADGGNPDNPWSSAMMRTIADLLAVMCSKSLHQACPSSWTCHKVGIPLELIPDTLPGRRGIGYHRQGVDPWRVSGGVKWSNSRGKVCPGDVRIAQIPKVIDMAKKGTGVQLDNEDYTKIAALIRDNINSAKVGWLDGSNQPVGAVLRDIATHARKAANSVSEIDDEVRTAVREELALAGVVDPDAIAERLLARIVSPSES